MIARTRAVDLANWEIFLWGLYQAGGDKAMVDVEAAFTKAHHAAPERFSWRTRRDLPEYKKLSKALRDADAKAGSLMSKTSDGHKRQFTVQGIDWIEKNKDRLGRLGSAHFSAGQSRSAKSTRWLVSLQESSEFQQWKKTGEVEIEKWRLAELLRCSPDSPVETWKSRLDQTGVAALHAGRDDVRRYLEHLKAEVLGDE